MATRLFREAQQGALGPVHRHPVMETAMAWAGLGAAAAILYGNVLSGWWAWDDSQLLKAAWRGRPWEYFYVPALWRGFQPANLNPWIILSYGIDLSLFGLSPKPFYLHQLFSLWLTAGVTYLLLRVWTGRLWAIIGALLFLVSAPAVNTAYQLMTRNYIEGLLFFSPALYLFVRAVQDDRPLLTWPGAGLYFLAMSSKETYAVLAPLLLLIPIKDLHKRLRAVAPFFLAMVLYAVWRRYMLGTWMGGYQPSIDWAAVFSEMLKAPSVIFGKGPLGMAACLVIGALVIYGAWRHPAVRLLMAGGLILLIGPIVPAVTLSDPNRLVMLITWAICLAVALILGKAASVGRWRRIAAFVAAAGIGLTIALQGWAIRPALRSEARGYEAHGRMVMEGGPDDVLLPSARFGNWYTEGLVWLRRHALHEAPPEVVYDEIDLAGLEGDARAVFVYDEGSGCLKEVNGGVRAVRSAWEQRLQDKPVSVTFDYRDGMVSWRFGPYENGRYSIIVYGRPEFKVAVPRFGFKRRDMSEPIRFRVRYDSPEGWTSYSRLMKFDGRELTPVPDPAARQTPEGRPAEIP